MKWLDKALAFVIVTLTTCALYVTLTYSSGNVKEIPEKVEESHIERIEKLEQQVDLLTDIIIKQHNNKPSK